MAGHLLIIQNKYDTIAAAVSNFIDPAYNEDNLLQFIDFARINIHREVCWIAIPFEYTDHN